MAPRVYLLAACLALALSAQAATFGRVVPVTGGATDLVLDEGRGQLYLISSVQGLVQVYSIQRQSVQATVRTDQTPISAALSRNGKFLYVTCYDSSVLDVIDLDALQVTARVGLPARPEGVAAGSDGRVLITTSGSGTNATANTLLLYDPAPDASLPLRTIPVAPAAASPPVFPPPSGRPFLATRSQLRATRDGSTIVGVNLAANGTPTVFVYEAASNSVLRSRVVAGSSTVLAVSDDGARFMCGPNLFDTATLQVLAQQNLANASYPTTPGAAVNVQSNQGGGVFSPDGQTLYAAFDIAPVQNPPSLANVSQLMLNDPDNLLIRMGIQLPENLAGKMAISADGSSIYALSDSGLVIIPVGNISRSPLAVPSTNVLLLARDPCGVTQAASATVTINNPGAGRTTANAQLLQFAGQPNQASPATAPTARPSQAAAGPQVVFSFNTAAARGLGTVSPPHDFLIQSPEAINIPDRVRVLENSRDADARGTVVPIPVAAAAEPFPDLLYDAARQRVYIANTGLNRVEVYDTRQQRLLAPVKVGQRPISMALAPDGATLYVANAGSEVISIVDPDRLQTIGRVGFPPIPFNSNLAIITPSVIATGLGGLQVLTTNGQLWKVVGNTAVPRSASKVIGQTAQGLPVPIPMPATMASTPGGEYVLLATNTGFVYLYDATVDDFVAGRQAFTVAGQTGYVGPVAAGPRGQFYVVNGTLFNQSLVPVGVRGPGLISAVAPMGNSGYAMYSPPPTAAANAAQATAPAIQILDTAPGNPPRVVSALEGPLTLLSATARANISGRTMAIDNTGSTAYVITASGLSVIPLAPVAAADRPLPNPRGAVNLASYQVSAAPNGLLSIFGLNLGASEAVQSAPLPTVLGGTCVTLNNVGLPLLMVSPAQINAQIPPDLAAGNYTLTVRSVAKQAASPPQQLAVSKYAPAVLVDSTGQLLLYHSDGTAVNRDNPANRDEPLTLFAVGLGATKGGQVAAGLASPSSPPAEAPDVQVFFGDPRYQQAEVIVDWSGLTPGYVGLYQINLRVPGFHMKGDSLPVTIRVGGVSSPTTGPVVPYVAVE